MISRGDFKILNYFGQHCFPVVDNEGHLKGILSLTDIRRVMFEKELYKLVIAKDIAIEEVLTVTLEDNLDTALKKMTEADIRELPVIDHKDSKKILSMLSRKDIIRAYHDQIERIKKDRSNEVI